MYYFLESTLEPSAPLRERYLSNSTSCVRSGLQVDRRLPKRWSAAVKSFFGGAWSQIPSSKQVYKLLLLVYNLFLSALSLHLFLNSGFGLDYAMQMLVDAAEVCHFFVSHDIAGRACSNQRRRTHVDHVVNGVFGCTYSGRISSPRVWLSRGYELRRHLPSSIRDTDPPCNPLLR